jgi:hypothetical protein
MPIATLMKLRPPCHGLNCFQPKEHYRRWLAIQIGWLIKRIWPQRRSILLPSAISHEYTSQAMSARTRAALRPHD